MLKYETRTEKNAKNVNDAKLAALSEFGLTEDEVDFEILEEGSKRFLGLVSKDARVAATVKDPVGYKVKRFLKEIFDEMQLDINIKTTLNGDNLTVDLSGEHMGIIIGKRGETLDSLQYITSLALNHDKSAQYIKVILNTENYREKRNDSLTALAERLAAKVIKTGKKFTLEPMNPYERRIIHATLQSNENVSTFSIGEDPYRKVVIAPKNPVKSVYHKRPYNSAKSYPHPKKHASYENFESYSIDNQLSEDVQNTEE